MNKIKLSERQWEMLNWLKTQSLWIGSANRRTVNYLIEKGLAKMDKKTGDVSLTNEGKNYKP